MEIVNFADEKAYAEFDEFARRYGEFMQSPKWGVVKSDWLCEGVVSRDSEGKIRALCLVLVFKTSFVTLLYSPRGYIGEYTENAFADIMEGVDQLAKKYRATEFQFDPRITEEDEPEFLRKLRRPDVPDVQPKENVILSLTRSFEEIERGYKSDYRNRIRKAIKRGVTFEIHGEEAFEEFFQLYEETGKRDNFPTRDREYFARMFSAYGDDCNVFVCRSADGEAVSAAVGLRFGMRYTYVYGASSSQNRDLYPCYLMQSEMIRFAQEKGCEEYDFGGVPHYHDEKSAGYRLWRFKHGFGSETVEFTGEYSKIYKKFTAELLNLVQRIRKKFRISFKLKRKRSNQSE